MSDPRLEEQADGSKWSWVPGAIFALALVGGVALWAYSSGDPRQQSALRSEKDATTGQSTAPARPAPPAPQR